MKTSAAPEGTQIPDVQLQTSKTSMTTALWSTSTLCHLQCLKQQVMALLENTQINLQQAEKTKAVQAMRHLVTPELAVIPQKWGPDPLGLVWIYQEQSEILSKVCDWYFYLFLVFTLNYFFFFFYKDWWGVYTGSIFALITYLWAHRETILLLTVKRKQRNKFS